MDICRFKNAEFEPKHQNTKVEWFSEKNIVKDDLGSCAFFTEEGSSASQMIAAKEIDVFVRLPGCVGQAADAVSVYTQVKTKGAPRLLKFPKSECPDLWIRFCWDLKRERLPNLGCLFVRRKRGLFLSVCVDDIKMAGRRWKSTKLGICVCSSKNKDCSCRNLWTTSKWPEKNIIRLQCGKIGGSC